MIIANSLLKYFAPKRIRSFLDFAEDEIVMPDGVRRDMKYTSAFMPWDKEFFKILDSSKYNRFWTLGSVQSGKTFRVTVIPALYHLFEIEEDYILGAPDERLANEFYNSKIKPIIKLSKYRKYLPKEGKGSRGGSVQSLLFSNGARLRFMGAGGGDSQRSGYTARAIGITEADKFDTSGAVSRETDPISQMEARAESYGDNARIYAECTVSSSIGRVYQEVVDWGSNSRCLFECPHCKTYIPFEREYFIGWQGKDNEIDAREGAAYMCPECSVLWSESDRQLALRKPKMTHEDGKKSKTFGFSWNAMSSGLLTMANIAQKEFVAERADTDDSRKRINQFVWSIPYDKDTAEMSEISKDAVLKKINKYMKGVAPDETEKITVGIDVGKYWCWWVAVAWRGLAEGYVIDYGHIAVPQSDQRSDLSILSSLSQFKEDTLDNGWKVGNEIRKPDLVLVDSGYEADMVYRFTKDSGSKYLPCKGFGTRRDEKTWSAPKATPTRTIGHEWAVSALPSGVNLVEIHSDFWKTSVHEGFLAGMGNPGNISIYNDEKKNHLKFARHICAEVQKSEFLPGKGIRNYWEVLSRDNHHFDVLCYARVSADILGLGMFEKKVPVVSKKKRRVKSSGNQIRTKY